MLKATPFVNGIQDLRWILRFLEISSWLTLQLLPDTFYYTFNIDEDGIADQSNVPGTEHGAWFIPVADLYKHDPEFGSLVHCTTMVWDASMLPMFGEVGKLRNTAQISDILISRHRDKDPIGKLAFSVLCTLMLLLRTIVSHIVQEPKAHHQHPSCACNHQTCYIHEHLWGWTVLH